MGGSAPAGGPTEGNLGISGKRNVGGRISGGGIAGPPVTGGFPLGKGHWHYTTALLLLHTHTVTQERIVWVKGC